MLVRNSLDSNVFQTVLGTEHIENSECYKGWPEVFGKPDIVQQEQSLCVSHHYICSACM